MSTAENSELTKRGFKSWQHFEETWDRVEASGRACVEKLRSTIMVKEELLKLTTEKFKEQLKEENEIRFGLKDYVAKPPERKYKIVAAKYVLYSKFVIPDDRDIEDAHAYWVKWDKLHVIWSEGEEKEEYEPYDAADQKESWKRPDSVFPGYYIDEVEECA